MLCNYLKAGIASFVLLVVGSGGAQAATINITTTMGNAQQTQNGVGASTSVNGADLVGALVTANYGDGSSEQVTWDLKPYSTDKGIAVGTGFDLYMQTGPILLTAGQLLTSLFFDLAPASTIFDMSHALEGEVGNTPTTKRGVPFRIVSGGDALEGNIDVTYSGIVNLAGQPAAGDIFTGMLVDFMGLTGGGFLGVMEIGGDMDTLAVAGDLTPVPLPASLPALAIGLGAFGFFRSTRKTLS